ncbi:hypothetical protein GY45DRAFT_1376449 [Cubamyces sp. BRFM 1775]|nr:hypothetical protein GY45DRAFT_1376449 [Cubamyces sp. BRFM 1775]
MSHSESNQGFGAQEAFYSSEIHAETAFPTTFGYADGYRFEDWYLASGTFIRNVFSDPESPPIVDARYGQLYIRFFPTEHLNTPFGQYYPHAEPMGMDLRFPNGLFDDRSGDAPVVVVPREVMVESPSMPRLETPPLGSEGRVDDELDFIPPRPEELDAEGECVDEDRAREETAEEAFTRALRVIVEEFAGKGGVPCAQREQEEAVKEDNVLTRDPRTRRDERARAEEALRGAETRTREMAERARSEELEYLEDCNKEELEEGRWSCDGRDAELYCDCAWTSQRDLAFQRECERAWADADDTDADDTDADDTDADVTKDVRCEGPLDSGSEGDSLAGSSDTATSSNVSACMTYLGESRLAYRRGSRATPSAGVSLGGFGEDAAYDADSENETEDGDVEMDVSESEDEQEENKQVEESGDKQEDVEIEEDDEDSTESSATAAGEDEGAKGYQPLSGSSAQASRFGTPDSFGPSTLESYER